MKFTKGRKQKIVERFRDEGESIAVIADWYERTPKEIEGVIREGLKSAHDALLEVAIDKAVSAQPTAISADG